MMDMQMLLPFLIKSGLSSGLLSGYYLLFLKDRKMQGYNRFYLLASVVVSLLIPFLHFEWHATAATPTSRALDMLHIVKSSEVEVAPLLKQKAGIPVSSIFVAGYGLISLLLLAALVAKVMWVYRLKRKHPVEHVAGYDIIHTDNSKAPFSFMRNLFWKAEIAADTVEGQHIIKHELVHIRQGHTLDKLFLQVVLVILWINPFYWLIQKELSYIHEFIADEAAIDGADTESFAKMLLRSHYGNSFPGVINPFFYSSIKRRLIMLNKSKKPGYAMLRGMMALPLLGAAIFLFSFSKENTVRKMNRKVVLVIDAGHGGEDNGAVSSSGMPEKDMALKVSQKLAALAAEYNINVVQTRDEDKYVTLDDRASKANDVKGDAFISVHINTKEMPGYTVILGKKNTQQAGSEQLAASVVGKLKTMHIEPRVERKSLRVLNFSNMPSILIECGDIDSAADMNMIDDDAKLEDFCRNVLSGVVDYLSTHNNKC